KQHALIRATQPYKWPRRATTLLCDVFPLATRRILRVATTENPKAFALVALGSLVSYDRSHQQADADRAVFHLRWLLEHAEQGHAGLCWGYPFNVFGKGLDTPAGTPIGVVCSIAGDAFARAYAVTKSQEYLDAVMRIAEFFLKEIPRLDCGGDLYCFGYTPHDKRRVHNANLHVVEHLYRTYSLTGDTRYVNAAEPALEFTVRSQRNDGAWTYGDWNQEEPYEKALMDVIDHHHTGFVLRSLHEIHGVTHSEHLESAVRLGYAFYRDRLFNTDGMPVTASGTYPVDIHACAEGILCPSALSTWFDDGLQTASRCLMWSAAHMRNPNTGLPYYRLYPWFASKLLCTRWGLAWMYAALSVYTAAATRTPVHHKKR
ncbi:MAG: hypothetical protein K1Y02_23325, partial [Candidatus Hydrogenedentes bacterium]|nr:hypothetical protein [Candidatus Hydrogenedentota bacterium]